MMRDDFPILDLPLTMQAAVIKNLGGAEALKIATINRDFRQMLSVHKVHATLLFYKFEVPRWDSRVYIEVNFGENTDKFWICVPHGTPLTLETGTEKRQTPLEIGDIVFKSNTFQQEYGYRMFPVTCLESDRIVPGVTQWEVLDMYASFLKDLIKVERVKVWGSFSEDNDLLESFLWKHHREFSEIIINLDNEMTYMENFKYFNEQLVVKKCKLTFREKVLHEHRSKYTTPITLHDVTLYGADFLHPDAILKSTSSFINLCNLIFKYSLMNAVVKTWMNGGLANLQKIWISCGHWQMIDDEEVLDGIAATKVGCGTSTRIDRVQVFKVRRSTDGALATVSFAYNKYFVFQI